MALRWESKRPAEVRTYQIDWTNFLGADTIASHTIVAVGVTVTNGAGQGVIDAGAKSITLKLSAGTSGTLARITNTIVTAAGETEVEKIVLFISDFAEPVSLELAKANLRKTTDDEDGLICSYVRAAREWVENYTGHILVRRPITQTFDRFGSSYLELYTRPISEVVDIDYTDGDGVAQTILPVDLLVTAGGYPYRIRHVDGWPANKLYTLVAVNYVAGYDEGEVPQESIQACLVLIAGMHANRGSIPADTRRTAEWICDQFRSPVV